MRRILRSPWSLLAAALALRSAGFAFGVLNIDESDFIVFGAGLWKGYLPYRDLVDIKPPLIYLTYLPAGLFGGMHVFPMRVLGVLWVFATALALRAAVRVWLRARNASAADASFALSQEQIADAGMAAAWLYLLALLCEIPSLGGELLLNLPIACALYFYARAVSEPARRGAMLFAGGLCVGLASLYKHQGAIALIALSAALGLGALLHSTWAGLRSTLGASSPRAPGSRGPLLARALGGIAILGLGFALPWAASFGFYAALHELPVFIDWVFTRNLHYAGEGMNGSAFEHGARSTLLCGAATLVPWVLAVRATWRGLRSRETFRDGFLLAATLLLWSTWLAVSAGGRFYEHYYLQFAPALAVLGALELSQLAREFPSLRPSAKRALALGCALPVLGSAGYSWARGFAGAYPSQEPRTVQVAAFVRAHSTPDETMFVWGHFTPIYVLSQRLPGTRYEHTSVHMGNFDPAYLPETFDAAKFRSDKDVALTLRDLEARKPALVIDTAPADIHQWHKVPLRAFPDLKAYIDANYRVIGNPANAVVYRRIGTQDVGTP